MKYTLDVVPTTLLADSTSRTISGLAIPINEVTRSPLERNLPGRFLPGSVVFSARTPLLAFHDPAKPAGILTHSEWTDEGLHVTFSVSKTPLGDEILTLANDGVLGLSIGVGIEPKDMRKVDNTLEVSHAQCVEISVTPTPAFAGAEISHVTLSDKAVTVPETELADGTPTVSVSIDNQGLADAIVAAMQAAAPTTNSELSMTPTTQPVPRVQVNEPFTLYRFDGKRAPHSLVSDIWKANKLSDGEAAHRLDQLVKYAFADTVRQPALDPVRNRPEMLVTPTRYDSPLRSLISTAGLDSITPFTFPTLNDATVNIHDHTESTADPAADQVVTASASTITPKALIGRARISREAVEASSPQLDAVVWGEMTTEYARQAEVRIAAKLAALTGLAEVEITGTNAEAVNGLIAALVALQYERGGNRYTGLVLGQSAYSAFTTATDESGRRLLPIVAPSNADGTTSSSFGSFSLGPVTGVPSWALGDDASYLFVASSVWQFLSEPRRFDLELEVGHVNLGLWGYSAEAITRNSDIKSVTYTA